MILICPNIKDIKLYGIYSRRTLNEGLNMENEKEDVVENINTTENTDTQTVEKNEVIDNVPNGEEKKFTQAQLNEIVNSRVKRAKNSESKKYSELMNVLKSAMGTDDVNEITKMTREYYENQGISIPEMSDYSDEDIETLAKNDAKEIANEGYDEIVDVLNDLKSKPNLSKREKRLMSDLTAQKKLLDDEQSLKEIGVDDDVINGKEFKDFRQKFNSNVDLKDVYELYSKLHPKEEAKPLGSVKSTKKDTKIKEYYSPEDFDKLTKEDLNNPKIWDAVMKSKSKWI